MEKYLLIRKNEKTLENKGFFVNVSKKVSHLAVVRNRNKRKIRATIRLIMQRKLPPITVTVLKDLSEVPGSQLETIVREVFQRQHIE